MFMLRADRAVTLYVARPVRGVIRALQGRRVPILMYHSISGEQQNGHPYHETATSLAVFTEHMKLLSENGYATMTIAEALKYVASDTAQNNKKYVVITFDDGYRDFYTTASPVLRSYGFSATVFLPTGYIAQTPRKFNQRDCLTWKEVTELQVTGVTFGSHTVSHQQLRTLSCDRVETELRQSKQELEDKLGATVHSFAYPYAFPEHDSSFVSRLKKTLEQCGYENGVSTIIGRMRDHDDRFCLKRLPINSWDDRRLFQSKLDGDYDWLHRVQYAAKVVRSGIH